MHLSNRKTKIRDRPEVWRFNEIVYKIAFLFIPPFSLSGISVEMGISDIYPARNTG